MKAAQIPLRPGCRVLFDFIQVAKEAVYRKEWHREFSDMGICGRGFLELVGLNENPLKPQFLDCQGMQIHSGPCSHQGALSALLSWGANYLLVSPPPLANKGPYFMHMPEGTMY